MKYLSKDPILKCQYLQQMSPLHEYQRQKFQPSFEELEWTLLQILYLETHPGDHEAQSYSHYSQPSNVHTIFRKN